MVLLTFVHWYCIDARSNNIFSITMILENIQKWIQQMDVILDVIYSMFEMDLITFARDYYQSQRFLLQTFNLMTLKQYLTKYSDYKYTFDCLNLIQEVSIYFDIHFRKKLDIPNVQYSFWSNITLIIVFMSMTEDKSILPHL